MMMLRFDVDAARQLVTVTSEGHPTVRESEAVLAAVLRHPDYRPHFKILYDRRGDVAAPEPQMVNWLVAFLRERRGSIEATQVAVVFPTEVTSMADTLAALDCIRADLAIDVRAFLRIDDALMWLGVRHREPAR